VAGELLGCYNHELAFKVMQEFRLPMAPIYVGAIAKIASKRQVSKIFDLLKNVKGSVDDKDWDEVVLAAIKVMVRDHNDPKTGEKLVDKLVYLQSKVHPAHAPPHTHTHHRTRTTAHAHGLNEVCCRWRGS